MKEGTAMGIPDVKVHCDGNISCKGEHCDEDT